MERVVETSLCISDVRARRRFGEGRVEKGGSEKSSGRDGGGEYRRKKAEKKRKESRRGNSPPARCSKIRGPGLWLGLESFSVYI